MPSIANQVSLYEKDILLWAEETVRQLKARDFDSLDLENLIEEIESLGISQKKELLSRLTTLLEHLIKRLYVNSPDDYNGWERTIRNQRKELKLLLYQVSSLKARWNEAFSTAWRFALAEVTKEYQSVPFPSEWQFSCDLEILLDLDFWR